MVEDTQEIQLTPKTQEKRGAWYLLTGLVFGLVLGLIYTWWINPIVYETTDPASLKENYKDIYRSTIAQVYAATGNLDRAARRLELLGDDDPFLTLGSQAQQALAVGKEKEARALALLASALQSKPNLTRNTLGTSESPATVTATHQVIPTQTLPVFTPTP